jgi:hypothetical protein
MNGGDGGAATLSRTQRLVLALAIAAMLLTPLLAARYPPVLDLAQQSAQLRLFAEAWRDPAGALQIQWSGPNRISYPVLALGWLLGGAEWGPRLGLLGCELAVVAAIFWLARRLGRPLEHAALASVFVFSGSLYGGFFNFLVGAVGFALWLAELGRRSPEGAGEGAALRSWARLAVAAVLLYFSHLLWLAAAGYVLLLAGARRRSWRSTWLGAAALAPLLLAGAVWYLQAAMRDERWAGHMNFRIGFWDRLTGFRFWSTAPLGGLRGPWEPVLLVAIAAWALFCLRRGNPLRASADRWLGRVALALAALYFVLPNEVGDTALLSRRWGPWAAILAVLALPPAGIAARWRLAAMAGLVLAHAAVTTAQWRAFDREEMLGFDASLAAVGDGTRLLELDLHRQSARVWIDPYFQMAAYAQLDRRVTLGYSFASTPTSLVLFRTGSDWPWPWTRGLEQHPERLRASDFDHFDLLLVHGEPTEQATLRASFAPLAEAAGAGPWRLYTVRRRADEPDRPHGR